MYALKLEERALIWQGLSYEQKHVFAESITFRMSDGVLDKVYHGSDSWRLFAVNIDYDWSARQKQKQKKHISPELRCICGRRLRYQFELESVTQPKRHVCLGSTHFAEHLGIPGDVAQEVRNRVSRIQSLMDEVLIRVRAGEKFPDNFKSHIAEGILLLDEEPFRKRILEYMRVDLPITELAYARVLKLIKNSTSEQRKKVKLQQSLQAYAKAEAIRKQELAEQQQREEAERRRQRKAEQYLQEKREMRQAVIIGNAARHAANVARRQQLWEEMMARKKHEFDGLSPEEKEKIRAERLAKKLARDEKQQGKKRQKEIADKIRKANDRINNENELSASHMHVVKGLTAIPKSVKASNERVVRPKGTNQSQLASELIKWQRAQR